MGRKLVVDSSLLQEPELAMVRQAAEENGLDLEFYKSSLEGAAKAADAEILFGGISPKVISAAKKMKWMATMSAGVDFFVKPGVLPEDCILTNSSGAYGVTISEHIIMVTLDMFRKMPVIQERIRKEQFEGGLAQDTIHGCRVTFMGTGDIGTRTAEAMRAMGAAKLVGLNRSGQRKAEVYDVVDKIDEADKYLPETDLLVMSMPGTPLTEGALSKERIALLPKTAYVVNVGRGNAIDQDALIEALNAGELAGAALDVMLPEPLPEGHPLWTTKNCLLTPHTAGQMTAAVTRAKIVELFCENIPRYLAGERMTNVIDTAKGY